MLHTKTNTPLKLAYARTIHTFQGQSTDPTELEQLQNAIYLWCQNVYVWIHMPWFNVLFAVMCHCYIGSGVLDALDLAIYFIGNFSTRHQVLNMNKNRDGNEEM